VSWASKKQNSVALSTVEAEYIAAGHCCAQLLWMRQTLRDYGYKLSKVPLLCDNESAIRMADNPVEHGRTKHIAIRYHFLRDHQQRGDIEIVYVSTKEQLVDIFTKPLDEKTFTKLRNELNILDSRNFDWYFAHIAHLYTFDYSAKTTLPLNSIGIIYSLPVFHHLSIGIIFTHILFAKEGENLFKGLYFTHKYPFLAIHAKGGESISPKQKDRTTTNFKKKFLKKFFKLVLYFWYISNWYNPFPKLSI
jgi:hypothetical protein